MTTLVYEPLSNIATHLTQTILIEKKCEIKSIRLYLYKSLSPTGSIILKCLKDGELLRSKEVFFSDMHDPDVGKIDPTKHFQGRVLFEFDQAIAINSYGNYDFQLHQGIGYSYTFDNHVGWIKMYERRIAPMITEPQDFTYAPYGLEFYDIKTIG